MFRALIHCSSGGEITPVQVSLRMFVPWLLVVSAIAALPQAARSARLLAVLPFPAQSHLIAFTALTRELARRGHEVTLVCTYPQAQNHPNQTVIAIGEDITKHFDFASRLMNQGDYRSLFEKMSALDFREKIVSKASNYALNHPKVKEILMKPIGSYDAIILEPFFYQEVMLGLGHHFQVPVIALVSHGDIIDVNYNVGGTISPVYKPHSHLGFTDRMNFKERALNTIFTTYHQLRKWYSHYPHQEEMLQKYFPGSPPLLQLLSNVSLTILNSNHILNYPAPAPPNMIFAGGMHLNKESAALPESLAQFMDEAKDGVVYFSMGTILKTSTMKDSQKKALMEAFRSLKQRVLIKWDANPPPNKPSNVRLESWLPQHQILAHPNMRLFITHGGLLSTQEAVYHGVPILGIPRFADQKFNMALACKKGYGKQLDYDHLSRETIEESIKEVLGDPKYTQAAKRLSRLFRERPIEALDNAAFWVEHVMRYGGAHLRPASVHLHWYQLLLLDLLVACLAPAALLLAAIYLLCRRRANPAVTSDKKHS